LKRIKSIVLFIVVAIISVGIVIALKNKKHYGGFFSKVASQPGEIQDFNFEIDSADVEALFHKGDNWYWMLPNSLLNKYSVDHMLRNRSSSQQSLNHDLVLKVLRIDGKLAAFLAYFKLSEHVWQLLFLMVDQDFRRQGIAKKILKFTVEDMLHRGAYKVFLATRNNNFRAQSLYKNFGFKQTDSDEQFLFFSWYKK